MAQIPAGFSDCAARQIATQSAAASKALELMRYTGECELIYEKVISLLEPRNLRSTLDEDMGGPADLWSGAPPNAPGIANADHKARASQRA